MNKLDIWTVIDYLPTRLPFSVEKLQSALKVQFELANQNEYFSFYKSASIPLAGGTVIDEVDLRVRKEQPHPGFLVLRLSGTCVPRDVVLSKYPGMRLVEVPRGRSVNEEEGFAMDTPWGELSFGFAVHTPECLRSVVFDPA